MTVVGLLHPGDMGSSVGAAFARRSRVLWASEGRSTATAARASKAGLEDAGALAGLVAASDVVVSVCPPHAAGDVAKAVAALGFRGLYLDANAVSPDRARAIEVLVGAAGAHYVDGGIVGGPAWRHGTTRLYLSGARASEVAALLEGSPLEPIVLGERAGAASALKMAYAAYSKGTAALVAAILAAATQEGVRDALTAEWARSQPQLAAGHERQVAAAVPKAWRYAGEMDEIAATFAAAGLPSGFHEAAAELYRRLEAYRDADPAPPLDEVMRALLRD